MIGNKSVRVFTAEHKAWWNDFWMIRAPLIFNPAIQNDEPFVLDELTSLYMLIDSQHNVGPSEDLLVLHNQIDNPDVEVSNN